jgi:hypothetical protein
MKNNLKVITIIISITNFMVLMVILDKIINKNELPLLMIFLWFICFFVNLYYIGKIKKLKSHSS